MSRTIAIASLAALVGLTIAVSTVAKAGEVIATPAVITHITGTPAQPNSNLPLQISNTPGSQTSISAATPVTEVGWRRRAYYRGYNRPYYYGRGYYRPYYRGAYYAPGYYYGSYGPYGGYYW
ncbi:MAG TPA: hypothetical protein VHV08_08125 [Pirellulales bacterium]|nr:hypothetical protein [Pirellulales bacterium]